MYRIIDISSNKKVYLFAFPSTGELPDYAQITEKDEGFVIVEPRQDIVERIVRMGAFPATLQVIKTTSHSIAVWTKKGETFESVLAKSQTLKAFVDS